MVQDQSKQTPAVDAAAPLAIGETVYVPAARYANGNVFEADYVIVPARVVAVGGDKVSIAYERGDGKSGIVQEIGFADPDLCFRSAEDARLVAKKAQELHTRAALEFVEQARSSEFTRDALGLLPTLRAEAEQDRKVEKFARKACAVMGANINANANASA